MGLPDCRSELAQGWVSTTPPAVLVIDDDEALRHTVADFLADVGFAPLLAEGGKAAIELLRRAEALPVAIVLDLHMPRVNGWAFRAQLAADPRLARIPVVVLTAERRAELTGPDVLLKPVDFDRLLEVLRAATGRG